jgi:hypothetical protein
MIENKNTQKPREVVKLPADIKAKWLEALRSGRYEQGRGHLRTSDDKFCCLGVLLDIIDPTKWSMGRGRGEIVYKWDGSIGTLPEEVRKELGGLSDIVTINTFKIELSASIATQLDIGESFADAEGMTTICSLTECNDMARYNFNQIASIIEKDL